MLTPVTRLRFQVKIISNIRHLHKIARHYYENEQNVPTQTDFTSFFLVFSILKKTLTCSVTLTFATFNMTLETFMKYDKSVKHFSAIFSNMNKW